jgi:hypothetical protein
MTDTHETDKELWLEAHSRAPAYTLQPGQMLSPEQRQWAREQVAELEAEGFRDHQQSRNKG